MKSERCRGDRSSGGARVLVWLQEREDRLGSVDRGSVTPVPSAGGAGSGASPTSAVPRPVVDEHWPPEVSSGGGHVTVYQPQFDAWDGSLFRVMPRWW